MLKYLNNNYMFILYNIVNALYHYTLYMYIYICLFVCIHTQVDDHMSSIMPGCRNKINS